MNDRTDMAMRRVCVEGAPWQIIRRKRVELNEKSTSLPYEHGSIAALANEELTKTLALRNRGCMIRLRNRGRAMHGLVIAYPPPRMR